MDGELADLLLSVASWSTQMNGERNDTGTCHFRQYRKLQVLRSTQQKGTEQTIITKSINRPKNFVLIS